ncbi:MopE-related protein [Lacinutrix sp. Bg11-31]|uniref:MopE-related protein n=1 Tax=Lacinutrix sp. Bg11-31 TaxID=2057808 RepID=UPI000C30C031|nr:putative metal-binding motif-containing protein [Lacinutrix sp. Bg11-31]AUC81853.1 hypothetical protein CW733_06785 [Lacinutrix sp. Bg11-31]
MKKHFFKSVLPLLLLVTAVFIIGSGCDGPPEGCNTWYLDLDGDGYGTREDVNCVSVDFPQPSSYADNPNDCDDTNVNVNPGATEVADNIIDEDCNGLHAFTFYKDGDDDGFGNANISEIFEITIGDQPPTGYVFNNADCDDSNNLINPLADEILGNNIDDNCDGDVDFFENYLDEDGDGYGSTEFAAADGVHNNIDCDDDNTNIHPYANEIPNNGLDENCDGND